MELKSTINIILKDLEEARSIIDDLKNYPGVPAIQVELAKAKCRSAESVIKLITESDIFPGQQTVSQPDDNHALTDTLQTDTKPAPVQEIIPEAEKIIADRFAPTSSLNEQLGNAKKNSGKGDIIKPMPVKDLSEAIGINDRFYFMRELFSGDQKIYNETIEKLNIVNSIDEASELLTTTTSQPDYSEPFQQLLELVERKLSSRNR